MDNNVIFTFDKEINTPSPSTEELFNNENIKLSAQALLGNKMLLLIFSKLEVLILKNKENYSSKVAAEQKYIAMFCQVFIEVRYINV